jgi:hypothetical protein
MVMADLEMQIFISSPGDVAEERALAARVLDRLSGEFGGRVKLTPIFWEHEPLLASAGFQEQIVAPSDTDMVICILWSRLGTRLPANFTRTDGSRYRSGTEFEFENALGGYRSKGKPELLVYRKSADPLVSLKDKAELLNRLEQKEALDQFVQSWFHDEDDGALVAAFHNFSTPDQFEELLELHLRKILSSRLPREEERPAGTAPALPPAWRKGTPFRGLDFFDYEHAPVFFGRTRAVSEILSALRAQDTVGRPFVLVLGMSGGGKSSVARAGVLPMLTQPGVVEGIGLWRRAVMRPGDSGGDPLLALATALLADQALPELASAVGQPAGLAGLLSQNPSSVTPLIRGALNQAAQGLAEARKLTEQPRARLALLVDQVEELFTRPETGEEQRVAFSVALKALAESGLVWILATMRSEFYARLGEMPDLVALKEGAGQYDLPPPSPAEIGQMIRQPALAAGLKLAVDPAGGERLEDVLRDAAVADPGVLPLLEFTLQELYLRKDPDGTLTLEACRELGGVEGALASRAEEVFRGLSREWQEAFPRVMRALVRVEERAGGTVTGRRVRLAALADDPAARGLVSRLAEARLLITDLADDGEAVVRLGHEALLRHWPRLAELIAADRDFLRSRQRVSDAARRWDQEGRTPDFLLTPGKPLEEGRELLQAHGGELDDLERGFIRASLDRGRRRRLFRRMVAASLVFLALVAGVAGYYFDRSRREAAAEKERTAYLADFLQSVFLDTGPSHLRGRAATVEDLLDSAAGRVQLLVNNQPLNAARLLEVIGLSYTSRGRNPQALAAQQVVHELRSAHLKAPHPLLAKSLRNLAAAHIGQGNYAEADKYAGQALAMFQALSGEKSDDAAYCLQVLAQAKASQGDLAQAEQLLRRSLQITRELHGDGSLAEADRMHDLGNLLMFRGQMRAAEDLARRTLAVMAKKLGPHHLKVILARVNLASLDKAMGRYHRVAKACPELLAQLGQLLEPDHFQIAYTRALWGEALAAQGLNDQAREQFHKALDTGLHTLEPGHPLLAALLESYAGFLLSQRDFAAAGPVLDRVSQNVAQAFGPRHPEEARILLARAAVLTARHAFKEAGQALAQSLEICQSALGKDHPLYAMGLLGRGLLHLEQGQQAEAQPLLAQALDIFSRVMGPEHPLTARARRESARALAGLGRLAEAKELAQKALDADLEALGAASPAVGDDYRVLGLIQAKQGRMEPAAARMKQALEIYSRAWGADNPEVTRGQEEMARLLAENGYGVQAETWRDRADDGQRRWARAGHTQAADFLRQRAARERDQGRVVQAGSIYELALAMYRRALPADHRDIVETLYHMGEVHQILGQNQAAEKYFQESLKLCRQAGQGDQLPAADNLYRLAQLSQERQDFPAAENLFKQALKIYRDKRGEEHPDVAATLHEMAWLEHLSGRGGRARELMREAHHINQAIQRPEDPFFQATLGGLATLALLQDDTVTAQQYYRELIPLQRKVLEPDDTSLAASLAALASLLLDEGKIEEAEPLVRESLAIRERVLPAGHWQTANAHSMLGVVLAAKGQDAQAEQLLLEGYEGLKLKLPPRDPRVGTAAARLASFYQARNRPEKAKAYTAKP